MSKKQIIIIISILIILSIVFLSVFFNNKNSSTYTTDTGGFSFLNLFPFGSNSNVDTGTNSGQSDGTNNGEFPGDDATSDTETTIPKLRQVSTFPISGSIAYNTKRTITIPIPPQPIEGDSGGDPIIDALLPTEEVIVEDATAIRYMEQSTSNIFETYTDSLVETRISNTTIPRIYDTYWNTDGQSFVLRYLDDNTNKIQTYLASLVEASVFLDSGSSSSPNLLKELKGNFITENITDISVSPDKTRFFTLEPVVGGVVGITSDFLGLKKSQVFESPLSEWLSFWPNASTITVATKPTGTLPGFMYSIDVNKKSFDKVLGGIVGLTTKMSPDGKTVLYSASIANGVRLYSYDMTKKVATDLGISTFPEKCVWLKDSMIAYCAVPKSFSSGVYPDIWYQGRTSFSDVLWRINLGTGSYEVLVDPEKSQSISIDMINLSLDPSEKYILFTNKKDGLLWNYSI